MIAFSTEGFLIYNLAFLNLVPYYQCYDSDGHRKLCDRLETCKPEFNDDYGTYDPSLQSDIRNGHQIYSLDNIYLRNWIEDLDLRCVENWEIGLFGSVFFIGHVLGSTFLSAYGDSIGRILLMRLA